MVSVPIGVPGLTAEGRTDTHFTLNISDSHVKTVILFCQEPWGDTL